MSQNNERGGLCTLYKGKMDLVIKEKEKEKGKVKEDEN